VHRLAFELETWASGACRVAGVDEAGRGPWAGPVFAAAVILEKAMAFDLLKGPLAGLTDSKQLTESRRLQFFDRLTCDARIEWAVAQMSAFDVDRMNILRATHAAMSHAVESLPHPPDAALIDGPHVPGMACSARGIVRGDSLSLSIAAASVLAKVSRDRWMCELDHVYPEYGFARHKGYGTVEHRKALARFGPCPEHRKTFRPVALRLASGDAAGALCGRNGDGH